VVTKAGLTVIKKYLFLAPKLQKSESQEEPKKRAVARKSTAGGSRSISSSEESSGQWQAPWLKQSVQRNKPEFVTTMKNEDGKSNLQKSKGKILMIPFSNI